MKTSINFILFLLVITSIPYVEAQNNHSSIDVLLIQNGGRNELYWMMNQEDHVPISHFIVQASKSGEDFYHIGTVQAQTDQEGLTEYNFALINKEKANLFYRIKIVERNEVIHYSKAIKVQDTEHTFAPLFLISQQRLNVFQTHNLQSPMIVELHDVKGQLIKSFELSENYEMSLENLQTGAYVIHYQNDENKGIWRFIKK